MPNLQELHLNKSYVSYGDDTISESLIKPCLKVAKRYRRSAGFFSSSVIAILSGSPDISLTFLYAT